MKTTKIRWFLLFFIGYATILAQEKAVSGKVVDENNGTPIPGANVIVQGTTRGVSADFDGNYSIQVSEGEILEFSTIGYVLKQVTVGSSNEINVSLVADVTILDQVVVVGYGSQRKSDVTGAISTVSVERLEDKPNTNFTQSLQGALPGITINQNVSSAEQGDVGILIRGRNSINASNTPLVVLDGIPYTGGLAEINPNDIKSINVLKDASSTAIYGSRGANGVILIETKKGVEGRLRVTFSTYTGINEIANLPEVYSGQGFAAFKETREPGSLSASEIEVLNRGESVDWVDLATRTGIRQDYNLSVAGGTSKADYFVSLGHQDVEGVSIGDDFIRTSLRANVNVNIGKHVKFGTATQIARFDRSGQDAQFSGEQGAFFANPLTTAFEENGDLRIIPNPDAVFFLNPLLPTLEINEDIGFRVFTSNYIEVSIPWVEGLKYRLNTGVEYETNSDRNYEGRNTRNGQINGGVALVTDRLEENYLLENIITYDKEWGKHRIGATLLYSAQETRDRRDEFEASGFPNDLLTFNQFDLAANGIQSTSRSRFLASQLLSQMARVNYGFDNRYNFTLTYRRDGFSGFGEDTRFGDFGSAAFAWNVHNESFFNQGGWFNSLKLRLTYGVNGNQDVGEFDNLARLRNRSFLDGTNPAPGFVPRTLANNRLTWETSETSNIGLDFGLFNNNIQLSVDAYLTETRDLLLDRQIPTPNGLEEVTSNLGETENKGIEVQLGGTLINTEDFTWSFSGNFSFNENRIVSLGGPEEDLANTLIVGEAIRTNFDFQFDGIWQEGDDIANSAQPDAVPGDVRVRDVANTAVDENGEIVRNISQNDDRVVQGQRDPKTTFGLSQTFKYKKFALSVFAQGVGGVIRENNRFQENVFGGVTRNWIVNEHWTPENPINTFHRNSPLANPFSVPFFESADFVRIKDITVSYTLDGDIFPNSDTSIKLYATGINLVTFTDWTGLDPELSNQQGVPLQKQYVFGLNVNF